MNASAIQNHFIEPSHEIGNSVRNSLSMGTNYGDSLTTFDVHHPEYDPEASEFESPHGTYIEGPHDPQLQREGVVNPLDQMGFTNPSNDVVTSDLQTSWQGSLDKMPWDLFRPAEGNAKETGELLGHPVITDASGTFVSTSQETLATSWKGSWDKFSIKPSNDEVDGVSDQVAQLKTGIQTGDGFDTVRYVTGLGEDNFKTGYSEVEWTVFVDDVGVTATQLQENCANGTFVKGGQLGYSEVEWTYLTNEGSSHDRITTGLSEDNVLRSDNRFAEVPVDLFQGLDAGGMNYAEAVGLDSSTFDVVNNLNSICRGCGRHGTPWQTDV